MSRNVFFILLPLCPYVSTTCPHKIKPLILLYPLFMLTPLQDRTKPSLRIGTYFKTFLCDVYFWNYSNFTLMPMCELNRSMLERGTYEDSFCHGGGKKNQGRVAFQLCLSSMQLTMVSVGSQWGFMSFVSAGATPTGWVQTLYVLWEVWVRGG